GHRQMPAAERARRLCDSLDAIGVGAHALGPDDIVAREGPDFAGRYERVFLALRTSFGGQLAALESVLRLSDPSEQRRRVAADTALGLALDAALRETMSLPKLVTLFGEEATRNPVEGFASHFARRVRHALGSLPAADNPY